MSNYPLEKYNPIMAKSHLKDLESPYPFILKRQKGNKLYDIDEYKYIDFYLQDGQALLGYQDKHLTHFIKNALSIGSTHFFPHKFHHHLLQITNSLFYQKTAHFFEHSQLAILELLSSFPIKRVIVNSNYTKNLLKPFEKWITILDSDQYENADLLFFEPILIEKNFSDFDSSLYKTPYKVCVESRSAFRFAPALYYKNNDVISFLGELIANGINAAVLLYPENKNPSQVLSIPLTVSITKTLERYKKLNLYSYFSNLKSPYKDIILYQGIFHLNKDNDLDFLIKKGLFFKDFMGYISLNENIFYDLKRLHKYITHTKDSL